MPTPETTVVFVFGAAVGGALVLSNVALSLIEMRRRMGTLLHRVDAKLDLLLKHADIAFDPLEMVSREIVETAQAGRKIQAIKMYRDSTGAGLREAKDFIEKLERK